jgi:hypothetical protein
MDLKPYRPLREIVMGIFTGDDKYNASDVFELVKNEGVQKQNFYAILNQMMTKGKLEIVPGVKPYSYRRPSNAEPQLQETPAEPSTPEVEVQSDQQAEAQPTPSFVEEYVIPADKSVPPTTFGEVTPETKIIQVPEGVSAKSKRLFWTDLHKLDLAAEAAKIQARRLVKGHFTLPMIELYRQAQAILPFQFQRENLMPIHLNGWGERYLEQAEQLLALAAAKEQSVEEKPAPVVVQEPTPKPQEPAFDLGSMTIDSIFGAMEQRIALSFKNILLSALTDPDIKNALTLKVEFQMPSQRALAAFERPNFTPMQADPPKLKLKRVVIFGLNKPNQIQEIKMEFADLLDLRFLQMGKSKNELRAQCKVPGTTTIVMSDFIDHASVDLLKYENADYILCAGGVVKLKMKLTEIYANT